jgi:hypothetical protein
VRGSGWDLLVEVGVVAVFLLLEVVGEVVAKVAVAGKGAELEDGFGVVRAPAGAGDVHAVFDQRQAPSTRMETVTRMGMVTS